MEIILIGLGASGVSFITQLSRLAMELNSMDVKVKIISEDKYFAKGEAFGLSKDIHILNTPIHTMGLDTLDPTSYERWFKKKNYISSTYTKRLTYSEYINQAYTEIKNREGMAIEEYKSKAINININDRICVDTSTGDKIYGDYLVYAPGSINSSNFGNLSKNKYFYSNPYSFKEIPKDKNIGVLGTSLTAVDVVRDLIKTGHRGKITMYSRTGCPPTCISLENKYIPSSLTFENIFKEAYLKKHLTLNNLMGLLNNELKNINNELIPAYKLKKNIGDYWKYLYNRSSNADLPYQDTLMSTRFYAHKIWSLLNNKDKIYFNSNFSSMWACWRHPIPREVIKDLYYMHDIGQLDICKIKSKPIPLTKGFNFNTNIGIKTEDYLIDGTGGNNNIKKTNDKFLLSLLDKGLAKDNVFGGLEVDTNSYQIINNISPNIYAIGQIGKGSLFSTNAFWFNAKIAKEITKSLLLHHKHTLIRKEIIV